MLLKTEANEFFRSDNIYMDDQLRISEQFVVDLYTNFRK